MKKYRILLHLLLFVGQNCNPNSYFSQEEYEHFMNLINNIEPQIYIQLRMCEKEFDRPCIEKGTDSTPKIGTVILGDNVTKEHPIIVLPPKILSALKRFEKNIFKNVIDKYKTMLPITQKARNIILSIIDDIAPNLYQEIIQKDPTGEHHIKQDNAGFASYVSKEDGLPIIFVDQYSLHKYSPAAVKASIAHELGHYVSRHLIQHKDPTHSTLFQASSTSENVKNARNEFKRAYIRVQENEADRRMVLDFAISIDDALANARALQEKADELPKKGPNKMTFQTTHPLWADRINHLESLRSEVELKKSHGLGKTIFDWKKLAQEHLDEGIIEQYIDVY